jgi:regulator of sigma D
MLREALIDSLETGLVIASLRYFQNPQECTEPARFPRPLYREVKLLCEQMLDYVSAGHFEMYSRLLEDGCKLKPVTRLQVRRIYRRIEQSTDQALSFNDKYDGDESSICEEPALPEDINRLCLALRRRFELEDQLITLLHDSQLPAEASTGNTMPELLCAEPDPPSTAGRLA